MIDRIIKVNLGSDGIVPIVKITQGDDMWRFRFQVMYGNKRWDIPSGAHVNLSGRKPDNHSFEFPCTIEQNEICVNCDRQLTACAGMVHAVLQIFSSEGRLVNTCKIAILCAEDAMGNAVQSDSSLSAYQQMIDNLSVLIEQYKNITSDISQTEMAYHVVYASSDAEDQSDGSYGSVSLTGTWSGTAPLFSQRITITGYNTSANTRVDLIQDSDSIDMMNSCGINTIFIENNNNVFTAYAFGDRAPDTAMVIPAYFTEVT